MKRIATLFLIWMASSSTSLLACAVCGTGETDPTRDAYTGSTALLSFIPLMAIGGVIYTIYRYVKKAEEHNEQGQ